MGVGILWLGFGKGSYLDQQHQATYIAVLCLYTT